MLLAVDIGNTNIKLCVFDHDTLISKISIPTARELSTEGLALLLRDRLTADFTHAIVSSVVPELDAAFRIYIRSHLGVDPLFVRNDMDFGLEIDYRPLEDAGADRLVNTFAAVEKYGPPCIVCSFGTALTIDVVDENRVLMGGLIAPGMRTMAEALELTTSRLPRVEIEKPSSVVQNTTVRCLQSGIVYGYFGLVEGLLTRLKNEIGDDPKVIATGGSAAMVAENSGLIDIVDPDLMVEGLLRLHQRITGR